MGTWAKHQLTDRLKTKVGSSIWLESNRLPLNPNKSEITLKIKFESISIPKEAFKKRGQALLSAILFVWCCTPTLILCFDHNTYNNLYGI